MKEQIMLYNLDTIIEAEVLKVVPRIDQYFNESYSFLVSQGHGKSNKYSYNDADSEAYFLTTDNPNDKVLVMGDNSFSYGGFKTAVCSKKSNSGIFKTMTAHRTSGKTTFHPYGVRKFTAEYLAANNFDWREMQGLYGDCRDIGFAFRWEEINYSAFDVAEPKITHNLDHIAIYLNEAKKFFFDIGNLVSCLEDTYG
jgi:hypothetical protein